ncbi:MAG: PHB depolymerase family esterase, partial [Ramlibacter sp.]
MNPIFQRLMRNVTRLVAKGDVKAATDAIQAALTKEVATPAPVQAPPPSPPPPPAPAFASPPSVIVLPDASRATPPPAPSAAPSPPGPGRVIAGSHGDALVRRDFKLFVPAQAGGGPLPLVVMLHGCTQDADDFAAGTGMNQLAREQGFYVLYPEQARHANPQRCWNWFKHSHQERGRGEPELIAGMTR